MRKVRNSLAVWAVCGAITPAAVTASPSTAYLGPSALTVSEDGRNLYVANADARQLAWIELPGGEVIRRLELPAEPTGLVLSPDGRELIVTCAAPKSTIVVIDVVSGTVTAKIPAGHTSMSPVITPDGKRLYVCNRFDNDVSVINLAGRKQTSRVPAVREPIAAAVTPDGRAVFVANHLPDTRNDVFFMGPVSPYVTVIDTQTHKTKPIELPVGSNGLRDLCISPCGKYAYVTHVLGNFERIPSQVEYGWANMNVISVIDARRKKYLKTVGLDELLLGAGNPWGIACTADGGSVCISHAGTHELSVVDASRLAEELPQMYISPLVSTMVGDATAGPGPWRRIKLPGKGPRGLAVAGSKVYVAEYFSDALAVVDLEADAAAGIRTVALGPRPELTARRRGELLFNDATICYQQWQSCASCHPDARADGLKWDLLNDGHNNAKNTKSMLLAHATPPTMSEGVRPSGEAAVRAGIQHILFADRPEEEAAAIDKYLRSLRPVPSPYLVDGRLSPAAERGKLLFESKRVGCSRCHPAALYSDLMMHDVGTRSPFGYTDRFDTPTLVEVWRTAPYLHNGRYVTIKELIAEAKHGNSRGCIDELSEQQIDDLVEFVLSL